METTYPLVPLGEAVSPIARPQAPIPGIQYRQIGVQLWGKGAYEREQLDGGKTQYKTLNEVHANDLIINKIWARNGSVAIVPDELAGTFGSNEFPTFEPISTLLLPRWMHWITKARFFWTLCDLKSRGTSGKNRIRPEKFLEIPIPLPSLAEQQRIVKRIDVLADKTEEARGLREKAAVEAEAVLKSHLRKVFSKPIKKIQLEEVCSSIIDCLHSNPIYADDGIPTLRSPDVGWGELFINTARKTTEEEYVRRTRRGEPMPGDIILVREGGGTGKAGIVRNGERFSLGQRVMMLRPDREKVLPEYLLFQLLSPTVYEDQILERCKGSASPHLNIKSLRKFDFCLHSLEEQNLIVKKTKALLSQVNDLKRHQTRTQAELDALLPSMLDGAFRGEI